jgi:hypothetical protein
MKEIWINLITGVFVFIILLAHLYLNACTVPWDTPSEKTGSLNAHDAEPQPPEILDGFDPESTVKDARLSAHLELPEHLLIGEEVNLKFTLTNISETPLYALKWYTPLEGIAGEIFKITRDGQAVPYEGILASRSFPTSDSYVFINAGESVSVVVDLGTSFDFLEAGIYQIGFISPQISHIARSTEEFAKTEDDLGPVRILSNPVTLEVSDK